MKKTLILTSLLLLSACTGEAVTTTQTTTESSQSSAHLVNGVPVEQSATSTGPVTTVHTTRSDVVTPTPTPYN